MVKKKKRSFMSKLFSRRILLLIQFIVSIIFLGCIYILKMLPMKYYLILCGIIFLLWMLSSLLIKSGIKKKKRENKYARLIFGKLLSLILSIALGFVSVMAFKGNSFLSNITGSFTQTRVICMYVKKESAIKSLRDVKDNTEIGIASEKGSKNITSAIAKIENKANKDFQTKDYKDYSLLGDAIMDGDIDVIVADNAYMALLEANHEGIDENLKSLYKVEIQEKLNSVTQETNVTKNPFIVYMTGIDTYGTVSAISRADVNLAVCVSPIQKQILIVSIPRDTQITLHKNGKIDKLTHSAMYGINETISSIEDFQKELEYVETAYKNVTGKNMTKYYRPPQGKYSEANLQMAKELGYKSFFWSLAYVDWYQDNQPSKEEAFSKLLGRIHPGAIVLLHSTSSTNAEILDELLTRWEEMGYHVQPLENIISTSSATVQQHT